MTPNALWQRFKQTGDPVAYMLYKKATGGEPPVVGGLSSFEGSSGQMSVEEGSNQGENSSMN